VHAGAVTLEHVRGMLHDERMTATVKRMRGLSPIEMRLLQLVAHQDDKGRRKGEDQCVIHGSAGPRSKAELGPLQSATNMPNNPKSVFPLKCMTCPQMPYESSHSARFFCVQHGQ